MAVQHNAAFPGSYRIGGQGVPGAVPERHGLVAVTIPSSAPWPLQPEAARKGHVHGAIHRDGGGERGWTAWCGTMPHACVCEQTTCSQAMPREGLTCMAQVTLERILQDIKTLEPDELMQVQQAV